MKFDKWGFLVIFIVIGIVASITVNYFALGRKRIIPGKINVIDHASNTVSVKDKYSETVSYEVEEFASGLFVPWSLVFTSADRMLVAQRDGKIVEIVDGKVNKDPLITFQDVAKTGESGLMGMDADSENNLYACLAYNKGNNLVEKVVKLKDTGSQISVVNILVDDIPAAMYHAGCRVKIGPDGDLYITTGDATNKDLPQDINSLAGKILRILTDGNIPDDNPMNSAIWSLGHRNPQGIAWSASGVMYETEHGPSVFDGPAGGDEVNVIKKGANYGWPVVSHEKHQDGMEDPKLVFTPAFAPASAMVYQGDVFPQFNGNLFFGGLVGEGIMRVIFSDTNSENVVAYEKLEEINFGRIRDVVEGPDGLIYFSTSNKDGRGDERSGDDKIYRLVPKQLKQD